MSNRKQPNRETIQREMDQGRYQTVIETILNGLERTTDKLARHPVGGYGPAIWALLFIGAAVGIQSVAHGSGKPAGLDLQIETFFLVSLGISLLSMILTKAYLQRVRVSFRDDLLGQLEGESDREKFHGWLLLLGNTRYCLSSAALYTLVTDIMFFQMLDIGGMEWIRGSVQLALLTGVNLLSAVILYYLALLLGLPLRLSQCHFHLHPLQPASSVVVAKLSSLYWRYVYLMAVIVSLSTLNASFTGIAKSAQWMIAGLGMSWAAIISAVLINQYSLSSIIRLGKLKSLATVQQAIEALYGSATLASDKDKHETMNRLMDYHDRIAKSPDSGFDLSAKFNLLNSLLIPVASNLVTLAKKIWPNLEENLTKALPWLFS